MKKIFYAELSYLLATVIISFGVAMAAAADFGVSMVVAPAYILSLKVQALSFGQAEYAVQALLFIVFCIIMGRFRPMYFFAFISCLIYGWVLDLIRSLIPFLNPSVCPPGSFPMGVRIVLFVVSALITALAIALYVRSYIYCQVYDYFVKAVSAKKNIPFGKFKTGYDISSLVLACLMTLLFFGSFRGIGVGTVILALVNGSIIAAIGKWLDQRYEFIPAFPKFAALFE